MDVVDGGDAVTQRLGERRHRSPEHVFGRQRAVIAFPIGLTLESESARQVTRQMRMGVHQSRAHHAAASVPQILFRMRSQERGERTDLGNVGARDTHSGMLEHGGRGSATDHAAGTDDHRF